MPKVTGKRAQQQRREELLRAEIALTGVCRYLANAVQFAKMCGADGVVLDYGRAFLIVSDELALVRREASELN